MSSPVGELLIRIVLALANASLAFSAGWWLCERGHRLKPTTPGLPELIEDSD